MSRKLYAVPSIQTPRRSKAVDTLPQLTELSKRQLVLPDKKEPIEEKVVNFQLQKLFPITLEQATCNYELLEQLSKSADNFVNSFKFNDSCTEGRKVFSWAWDTYSKTKELLEFYDCVSEQLESGVAFESVKLGEAI